MKQIVILHARFPTLGKVKTRLAKTTTDEFALEVYTACLEELIEEHKNADYDFIVYTPTQEQAEKFTATYGVKAAVQQGDSIGLFLADATKEVLSSYDQVIHLGADTPLITQADIKEAFEQLKDHDVVIGPAADGGYYLFACKESKNYFDNIEWSTSKVLEQSITNIKKVHATFCLLKERTDIDTLDDLKSYAEHKKLNQLMKLRGLL